MAQHGSMGECGIKHPLARPAGNLFAGLMASYTATAVLTGSTPMLGAVFTEHEDAATRHTLCSYLQSCRQAREEGVCWGLGCADQSAMCHHVIRKAQEAIVKPVYPTCS